MQCQYDTGSRYGNRPACSAPATNIVTYRNGSYGPFTVHMCPLHTQSARGRVWPDDFWTEVLPQTS